MKNYVEILRVKCESVSQAVQLKFVSNKFYKQIIERVELWNTKFQNSHYYNLWVTYKFWRDKYQNSTIMQNFVKFFGISFTLKLYLDILPFVSYEDDHILRNKMYDEKTKIDLTSNEIEKGSISDFFEFAFIENSSTDWVYYLSELFLINFILAIIVYFICVDFFFNYRLILLPLGLVLTIINLIIIFILSFNLWGLQMYLFEYSFFIDNWTIYGKMLLILSLILCLSSSYSYLYKVFIYDYEYVLLILCSLLGAFTVLSSLNFLTFYIGIEMQSLSFYILASFKKYNNFSTEAGIKYFIMGGFSSGLLLFSFSLFYGITGSIYFHQLQIFQSLFFSPWLIYSSLNLSIFMFLAGLLFKLAAAPFHMWAPDVYEGSPTSVTLIFSILPKILILFILIKFTTTIIDFNNLWWETILMFSAILSILIGTFSSLYQVKIKRLLAFSGITHTGFLLILLGSSAPIALYSIYNYLFFYIMASINIFTILLNARKWNLKSSSFKNIYELALLRTSNPMLSYILILNLFSLAGIPPLTGFYAKYLVFSTAAQMQYYWILIFLGLISIISAFYYVRIIKLIFFKEINNYILLEPISLTSSLIISYTGLANIFFFFFPNLVFRLLFVCTEYYDLHIAYRFIF